MEYGFSASKTTRNISCDRAKSKLSGVAAIALGLFLVMGTPGKVEVDNLLTLSPFLMTQNQAVPVLALAEQSHVNVEKIITSEPIKRPKKAAVFKPPTPNIKPDRPVQMASLEISIPRPYGKALKRPRPVKPTPYAIPKKLDKKLFGAAEFRFDDERKIKAWSSVYHRFVQDTESLKTCVQNAANCNDPVLANWAHELRRLKGQPRHVIISQVNIKANQISHVSDRIIYGRSDYWASPSEFLQRAGDCEDFALLKFASLLALGFENRDLRLVVGTLPDGRPHAFLAVKDGADEIVMDNLRSQVFTSRNRSDYIPKYSVNLTDRWSHYVPPTARQT